MATKPTKSAPPRARRRGRQGDSAIAANVRAEMARRGMSADGLAVRAGLTVHQLRRRLRGEATITAAEVHALAQALRVPATQLLDYPGPDLATREVAR